MIRKGFMFLFTILLVFSTQQIGFAGNDVTPLKLKKASINLREAKVGDKIIMTFEVEPDYESGPGTEPGNTSIRLTHSSGASINSMLFYLGNNIYEFSYPLDSKTLKGEWQVDYIELSDEAGNRSYYNYSDPLLSEMKYNVLDGVTDSDAPVLNALSLSTPKAKPGDTVKVTFSVQEENGPARGRIIFTHTKTDTVINEEIKYNAVTKKYEADISLPDNILNGEYQFSFLYLTDTFDNEKRYLAGDTPFLTNIKFDVTGGLTDFEKPVFHSAELLNPVVYGGDTLTAFVTAEDKGSGINRVTISFTQDETRQNFWTEIEWDASLNKYRADIPIKIGQTSGQYSINQIAISDNVGNYTFVSEGYHEAYETLPKLRINSLFSGVDSGSVAKGSSFDPMSGVKAFSTKEGDRTSSIQIKGEVNTAVNGIYL